MSDLDECIIKITSIGAEYDIEDCLVAYLAAFVGTCTNELKLTINQTKDKCNEMLSRIQTLQ